VSTAKGRHTRRLVARCIRRPPLHDKNPKRANVSVKGGESRLICSSVGFLPNRGPRPRPPSRKKGEGPHF